MFAPTNEAFFAIALALEEMSEEEVRNVLEYHVVATGELNEDAVLGSSLIQMANRAFASVDADAGTIAGATIIQTDIRADNGIVHVIDAVMLPPGDIPTVATEAGGFGTLSRSSRRLTSSGHSQDASSSPCLLLLTLRS